MRIGKISLSSLFDTDRTFLVQNYMMIGINQFIARLRMFLLDILLR